jgi:hypothetical protein
MMRTEHEAWNVSGEIIDVVELSNDEWDDASRWKNAKKNRAMETLFVECVDGDPYSRWRLPMAERVMCVNDYGSEKIQHLLKRVTGGAKDRGEQIRSFMKEEK